MNTNFLGIYIRAAEPTDVVACKVIADQHRAALGFLPRAVFAEAITHHNLLVAATSEAVVTGFVRFNHRQRGTETAIYDLGVASSLQGRGIGRALVCAVAAQCRTRNRAAIILRCPEGLPANEFYARVGFQRNGVEEGRRRRLVVWRLLVEVATCAS